MSCPLDAALAALFSLLCHHPCYPNSPPTPTAIITPHHIRSTRYWFLAEQGGTVVGMSPFDPNYNSDFGNGPTFTIDKGNSCASHDSCELNTFGGEEYCDRNMRCSYCDECTRWFDAYDFNCPAKCGVITGFVPGDSIPDATEADTVGALQDYLVPGCPGYSRLVTNTNPLLQFGPTTATSTPRLMTARLSDKLDALAAVLATDTRFDGLSIYVHEAYQTPPADDADASLHNAGRAALLSLVQTSTQTLLGQLGRLAAFVGTDWVHFQSSNRLYISVLPDQCNSPIDLVLLLDGSGSINMPRHGGDVDNFELRMKEFARRLVPEFNWGTGNEHSRFSMVTFASNVQVDFHLNEHHDNTSILAAIDQARYPYGGTYISQALERIRTNVLTTDYGMRDASLGIPRVIVAITDGVATAGWEPATEAALLRGAPVNANIFAMGVGLRYSVSQLEDMASSPVSKYVHTVKTFDRISAVVDQISATACRAPTIIGGGSDGVLQVGLCEFRYFQSPCGALAESIVEVTIVRGMVNVYVGNTSQPGPFSYQFKDESADEVKVITAVRAAGDTSPLYVAIKGMTAGENEFRVRIWSNIFSSGTTTNVTVDEDTAVSTVIFTPTTSVAGATYGIAEGNADGKFSINSATGTVTLVAGLDYETAPTSYRLKITGQSSELECQNGVAFLNVVVGDVNDVRPVFQGLPYDATVSRTATIGTNVLVILASDPEGGTLAYSLVGARRGRARRENGTPFAIDGTTGQITTDAIVFDDVGAHSLIVTVTDGDNQAQAAVTVTVSECTPCLAGEWEESPCSVGSPPVCTVLTTCGPGTIAVPPTSPSSDRACVPCPEGHFQTAASHTATSCQAHRNCSLLSPPEVVLQAGTTTVDTDCYDPNTTSSPTPSPATSSPTPSPATSSPTPSPAPAPTGSPTIPGGVDLGSDASSGSDTSSELSWWPALLVLLLLALLLAFLLLRHSAKPTEKGEASALDGEGFNPLFSEQMLADSATSAALLGPYLAGDEPLYALAHADNTLYDMFRRCIAFDHMYYGNKPLELDNDALNDVYQILAAAPPPPSAFVPLRDLTQRFLDTEIDPQAPNANVEYDVVKFIWDAAADDLMERAIDALARHEPRAAEPVYALGGGGGNDTAADALQQCMDALSVLYIPENNQFLVPVTGNSLLRQLPHSHTDPAYDMGGGTGRMADLNAYALAAENGAGLTDYAIANFRPSTNTEYAISDPAAEGNYQLAASGDVSAGRPDSAVYAMADAAASGNVPVFAPADGVYDLAGQSGQTQQGGRKQEAVYDLGGTSGGGTGRRRPKSDAVYDLGGPGGGHAAARFSILLEPVYDMGGTESGTDDLSDLGDVTPGAPTYDAAKNGAVIVPAVYDQARNATSPLATPPLAAAAIVPAVYDQGSRATSPMAAAAAATVPAVYDQAQAASPAATVIVPAVYDQGSRATSPLAAAAAVPAVYDQAQAASPAPAAIVPALYDAAHDGTLPPASSTDTLVPQVYEPGQQQPLASATYDAAAAASLVQRTRSYEGALEMEEDAPATYDLANDAGYLDTLPAQPAQPAQPMYAVGAASSPSEDV